MKLGNIEVSGIKRIVDGKAHWERYRNRWVKYVGDRAVTGLSEDQMCNYLNAMVWSGFRIWVHNETINIDRKR